jgi:hypothetical protein
MQLGSIEVIHSLGALGDGRARARPGPGPDPGQARRKGGRTPIRWHRIGQPNGDGIWRIGLQVVGGPRYHSIMCSIAADEVAATARRIAEIERAIDDLAVKATPAPGASIRDTDPIVARLAELWTLLAELDPEVARRLAGYRALSAPANPADDASAGLRTWVSPAARQLSSFRAAPASTSALRCCCPPRTNVDVGVLWMAWSPRWPFVAVADPEMGHRRCAADLPTREPTPMVVVGHV